MKERCVGVYFHGSLRLGGFNPQRSDVDFIVVTDRKMPRKVKKRICGVMMEHRSMFPEKGFEFSMVLERYCREFLYPTPYELHMSRAWEELYRSDPDALLCDRPRTDPDLASHFHVLQVPNAAMDFGPPSSEVFCEVPREFVAASNWRDVKNAERDIAENPVYTVLNLCRFYAFLKDGLTLSKKAGGEYALACPEFPGGDMIRAALADYSGESKVRFPAGELSAFACRALELVRDAMEQAGFSTEGHG